jgi:DnaA-homolog protein
MAEQFVLDLARPEPPTFANFVAGDNREALAALRALASGQSRDTGVLLWGASGVGKSHLLSAAASHARSQQIAVECATPADVPSGSDVPATALLIVDDVDTADPGQQGRLFTRVNTLATNGGQWIVAACAPPARLALRDDLRTRLALGLVFEVVPLADADKPQALATYARERGFRLSDEVIGYLLAHGRRDMPSLVATLAALDRHSLASQRAITVPLLRAWQQRDLGLSR